MDQNFFPIRGGENAKIWGLGGTHEFCNLFAKSEARKQVANGINPSEVRKAEKASRKTQQASATELTSDSFEVVAFQPHYYVTKHSDEASISIPDESLIACEFYHGFCYFVVDA